MNRFHMQLLTSLALTAVYYILNRNYRSFFGWALWL